VVRVSFRFDAAVGTCGVGAAGFATGLWVDAERAEDAGVDPRGVDQGGRGPRPLDVREQLRTVAAEVMAALKG